jgi:DNA-binding XRE family transcriptional regulator
MATRLVTPCHNRVQTMGVMPNRLRQLRRYHGHSLRSLAAQVGVSHETVWRYEREGLKPGCDREPAVQIAEFFGRQVEEVFPEATTLEQFRPPDFRPSQDAWSEGQRRRAQEATA